MENNATCQNCPHYMRSADQERDFPEYEAGECHHNPPKEDRSWPQVWSHDWCSRHPERMLALSVAMNEALKANQKTQAGIVVPRR